MGSQTAHPCRRTSALALTLLAAVAIIVMALAGPASALPSWDHGTATSCTDCHTAIPATAANATILCSVCHGGFTTSLNGSTPANCGEGCHVPGGWTATQLAAVKTNAASGGCGNVAAGANCHARAGHAGSAPTTCVNCHGVTASTSDVGQSAHHKASVTEVTVKALVTIKASATRIAFGKTVKLSGIAKSVQAGYVVKVVVQKKGTTWKTIATKPATWDKATATWKLTYKPTKKGTYRFQATTPLVVGTNGNAVAIPAKKTAYKNLTVK